MTLPNGSNQPPISLGDIQTEFGLGANLNAYYNARWFKDDNSRGYFQTTGQISLTDFYSKRKNSPVVPNSVTLDYATWNNRSYSLPMFNNLSITAYSGQGGTFGQNGNCRNGTTGGTGAATSFGNYVSTSTGAVAGYGGTGGISTGSTSLAISDANQASIIALYNTGVTAGIGAGGYAGGAGAYSNQVCACAYGVCVCANNCDQGAGGGSGGSNGYIVLSWS